MKNLFILLFVFLFCNINVIKCFDQLIGYNNTYLTYSYLFLNGDIPRLLYDTQAYFLFYSDDSCKTLRYGSETTTPIKCMDRGNPASVCTLSLKDSISNFYGNSIGLVYYLSPQNTASVCFNSTESVVINSYPLNYNVYLPKPYSLQFSGTPSTRGGDIKMTGYFIRTTPIKYKPLIYQTLGVNTTLSPQLEDLSTINVDNYNQYTFKVRAGAGSLKLFYSNSTGTVSYASPTISSINYNSSIIEIIGDNFYIQKSLVSVYLDGNLLDASKVVNVVDHSLISIQNTITSPGVHTFMVTVSSLSSPTFTKEFKAIINEITYTTSISKYNGGDVTINGVFYYASISSSSIFFGLDTCTLISYSSNSIVCNLPKSTNPTNQVNVLVSLNQNQLDPFVFNYGKPKINKLLIQQDKEFTIQGLNFHDVNLINITIDDGNNVIDSKIESVSNDEVELVFKYIHYTPKSNNCGNQLSLSVKTIDNQVSNQIQFVPSIEIYIISSPYLNGSSLILSLLFTDCNINYNSFNLYYPNDPNTPYSCIFNNNDFTLKCNTKPSSNVDESNLFYLILNDNIKTQATIHTYKENNNGGSSSSSSSSSSNSGNSNGSNGSNGGGSNSNGGGSNSNGGGNSNGGIGVGSDSDSDSDSTTNNCNFISFNYLFFILNSLFIIFLI